jgi:hypothetical protein
LKKKKKVIVTTLNSLVAVHMAWSLSLTAPVQLLLLLHIADNIGHSKIDLFSVHTYWSDWTQL